MSQYFLKFISIFIFIIILTSCATHKAQFADNEENWTLKTPIYDGEIEHTFYLVGDAGNADLNKPLEHFNLLREELKDASSNSTVLFLGDNLYPNGLVKKNDPVRNLAEHRLNVQLNIVTNYKGKAIFIPGNHDYYSNGIKGLNRQETYINKRLGENSFLPKNGCPIKKLDISDEITLIIVDTQWYLEDWNKNPTMNDNCEIKTREKFFDEFEGLLKKNATKTILIALHHPMFSNGSHGGQYSLKKQFYPSNNKIPLPVIGTIANVLRKTSGISPQDINNPMYLKLKKRLVTLSQVASKSIFVSGHDHNLQYIFKDNKPQIISGSGSKTSASRAINGGKFSYGGLGYAKLEVFKNGASQVSFYKKQSNQQKLLYKTTIFEPSKTTNEINYPNTFLKSYSSSIYKKAEISKSKLFKLFWGEHYRNYYGTKINAPTAYLDTLMGGLTPIRKGGGNQSKSVRLRDKNGKEFIMRALRKSATQFMQAVAFKDQYIEGQYDDTYAESLLLDIYTAAHPFAPLTIGKLADVVDIYHTNPKLYYIPKQNALKDFNNEFGNELYILEERATSGHGDVKSFGFSNKLISTDDLLKNLRKSDNYRLDESLYIRTRLFDMLIGDWDRHEDQWRWAEFKTDNKIIYKPVPRDRDQAFSKNDGLILEFLTRAIPALKLMQVYDDKMRNVKWFNLEPYPLDIALINSSNYEDWLKEAAYMQKHITDNVIESAFNQLPAEVKDNTCEEIKKKLKGRLNNLQNITKNYYKYFSKYAVIKGNDKDNWFEINRQNNGVTSVKIYNIKNDKKGSITFEKLYNKNETDEIWVFGLDDTDVFKVTGVKNNVIPLKLIGGQNNDKYLVENGKRVTIYDYKSKKNSVEINNGHLNLTDNYETNVYNYKKLKYSRNQFIPSIGSNPDDGYKIGFNNIYTVYGFERNPFSQQHRLKASYYFANKGFDINYTAEFGNILNNWNLQLETHFTSPNYSINHYGFGNNSENLEKDFGENYHRVKISTISVKPSLKWIGRMGAKINIGGSFESLEVENTSNRYINTIPNFIEQRKKYGGIYAQYKYENYDNKSFPTLGINAEIETGWKTNLDELSENNGYFIPSLGINYKLSSNGKLVLATKLKGNIIIGDHFEFYNAASIGGLDGLRGYRNQRFIGNKSFYQNSDIRLNLRKVKTEFVPIQLGVFGGFDYGRVWLKNEDYNGWKTSYGAGIWLVGANMFNLNLSIFNSTEGPYFNFNLGFGF